MGRASKPVPEAIIQLQRQLEQFRSTQPSRTKLPEAICLSGRVGQTHGVNSVAYLLRLDYAGLKRRLGGGSGIRQRKSKPAFVELAAAAPSRSKECVI